MTKKIFRSIIVVAMTVLLAGIAMTTTFIYDYFNKSQIIQLKDELALVADTVNDVGVEYFENFDSAIFRFTVIAKDGTVLYDTEADPNKMENHADREEIKEAIKYGTGSSARTSSTLTEKTFYEAVSLENGDVLRVSISQLTVGSLILGMMPVICAVVLAATVVSIILSNKMAKSITEPLNRLNLDDPLANDAYEELSPILNRLNKQQKQMMRQMDMLKERSDEFEQITSSMSEGLILLNENGLVVSMNKAAKQLFAVSEVKEGSDFLAIDRSHEMRNAVNEALNGHHSEFRAQKNGLEYQFDIDKIESSGKIIGAVILAFDITERAFAERNRQEFSANVSHEMKTPLQSIIGSAELLENGLVKPEDTQKFIGNIKKEAARMVNLINDIIRLSQLDEKHDPPTETVNLTDVANEVTEVLTASAAKKNITLSVEGSDVSMIGVRGYIYEIIYNLCDNAIRYNVDGGKVTIGIEKQDGKTVITVSDTGIGIAPEHQSRVFERFYRVDKSHSKETGGTGLGLSIVKHAVQFHNGRIELHSEVGKGTTVRIHFKNNEG